MYRIIGSHAGQTTISTWTYLGPVNSPTQTMLGTLLTSISANLRVLFLTAVGADWTLTEEQLAVIHRNDIATATSVTHAGTAGSRGSPSLGTTVAAVILRTSVTKGQHGRGRLSVPCQAAADCTASRITSAPQLANLANLANAQITAASDGVNNWIGCIAQRSNASPRLAIGASLITSLAVPTLLGTIRRRKIGRGI